MAGRTRRDALRRGLFAGGAALSAAAVPGLLTAGRAFAQEAETSIGDSGIVEGAVNLEQTAVLVYETGAQSGFLGPAESTAKLFAGQEQQHADVVIKMLRNLGGTVPAPPLPQDVPGLSEVKTRAAFLDFVLRLENEAIATYADAIQNLQDPVLMKPMAQIMANEGQHLVVLRQALGADPVPSATPTGLEKS
jgi:rubrerythrin